MNGQDLWEPIQLNKFEKNTSETTFHNLHQLLAIVELSLLQTCEAELNVTYEHPTIEDKYPFHKDYK